MEEAPTLEVWCQMTTDELMTAEDAALVQGFHDGANIWLTKVCLRRILATYHALTEKTAECERVNEWGAGERTKFLKAYDEARLLRAQLAEKTAELARIAPLYKDSLRYGEELRQLLAAAQADSKRLREALRDIASVHCPAECDRIARAALDHAMTQEEK